MPNDLNACLVSVAIQNLLVTENHKSISDLCSFVGTKRKAVSLVRQDRRNGCYMCGSKGRMLSVQRKLKDGHGNITATLTSRKRYCYQCSAGHGSGYSG